MSERPNISSDLVWEIVRNRNAFLVKRNSGGGVQFSRDPFNLANKHSRKHAGFVNEKAVSVQPTEKGGVRFAHKQSENAHKPAAHYKERNFGSSTSGRKIYKSIAEGTGKNSYRSDLNQHAVSRASAIKNSQRTKKDLPEKKPRGLKARKTEES